MHIQTEIRNLKDLKVTNPYLRLGMDVTDLEKSIRTVGLIAPLVISTDNVILAGARRFQALLNLGFTKSPVVIIDKGELEKELISIDENLVRKDLNKIEIEGHLRRAKEIYQVMNPIEDSLVDKSPTDDRANSRTKKVTLPAEKFLNIVAEKTGLSPRQIQEAINRDEMSCLNVKEARQNGELSIGQTNEIVKLNLEDQKKSLQHIKNLPVREIRGFVKLAKSNGVESALKNTPKIPNAREFNEIDMILRRLQKKLKQLEIEGITLEHFPIATQEIFSEVADFGFSKNCLKQKENIHEDHSYS